MWLRLRVSACRSRNPQRFFSRGRTDSSESLSRDAPQPAGEPLSVSRHCPWGRRFSECFWQFYHA